MVNPNLPPNPSYCLACFLRLPNPSDSENLQTLYKHSLLTLLLSQGASIFGKKQSHLKTYHIKMSRSSGLHGSTTTTTTTGSKKLKGVRRRKWGKWVSEIRVPGTKERLWLGTYATPEAAAVAHDVAVYYLRRPSSLDKLNFPDTLSSYNCIHHTEDLSPRSVQKVASDVAMDVDARNINAGTAPTVAETTHVRDNKTDDDHRYNTSVPDVVGFGAANVDDCGVSWWDGLGDDCGTCQGSEDHGEGEALSISIEDYL